MDMLISQATINKKVFHKRHTACGITCPSISYLGGGGYLPWKGVPTFGYPLPLSWPGLGGIHTLDRGRGTYLGVPLRQPDLAGGYLPWIGVTYLGVPPPPPCPDLASTYLGWGVPTLGSSLPPPRHGQTD